ncbi:MAG: alkaline phosphatase family protein [Opitutus sp.]|nr:alkaline phosphatase family protein [Opitutus sp.]
MLGIDEKILRLTLGLAAVTVALAQSPAPVAQPQRPIPEIEHIVIISVDGLRPDRLLLANSPVMHAMVQEGAYTFWAKTTAVSITLPSHVSMLTGVNPRKHKIEWNDDLPLKEPVYPKQPTIFEMAKKIGYTTALVSGKAKFGPLTKPGTLDYVFMPEKDLEVDEPVCVQAVDVITRLKPNVLFVHFPANDKAGHKYGWGSAEQMVAIEKADACIGRIVAALEQAGIKGSTFMIVTADHGGAGLTHGPDDPRSRTIPWIATGPRVRKKFDLTQIDLLEVRTEDTGATACWLLGLALPVYFDGKPVRQAFLEGK